jgi:hypothetical protein
MKRLIGFMLLAALAVLQASAQAQPRHFSQAELDALLAPVALYPDSLLSHVLVAATYPEDLREAAAWSRANPHLKGDDAVRAAEPMLWHPSVKALLAFPDLLARMDESPQWTADLGTAFLEQEPYVMDTVQALRRRAQASGTLQSDEHQRVIQQGETVIVQPAQPHIVYVPYYNPYVVYGPWWWHSYHPVLWRPWHPRPVVFVSTGFFHSSVDWHRRRVHRVHVHDHHHDRHHVAPRPVHIQRHHQEPRREHRTERSLAATVHNHVHQAQTARPIVQSPVIPQNVERHRFEQRHSGADERGEHRIAPSRPTTVHNQVHQAQTARPIVQGAQIHQQIRQHRSEEQHHRADQRREHRIAPSRPATVHSQVHQAQTARPIVQGAVIQQNVERHRLEQRHPRADERREHPRAEQRREHRNESRREHRQEGRQQHRNGRG